MNSEDLNRLHAEYRQHVEAARDETASTEARSTAQDLMIEARHALDAALIEVQSDAEDDARSAAVEAAARIVAAAAPPAPSPFPLEAIRAYGQSKKPKETLSFVIPFSGAMAHPKLAQQFSRPMGADWTTTDTTTYSSYTVPQTWQSEVYMFQHAMSGVLAAGPTILNTANGNQINYPKLTTDMASAAGAEGVAATETNPVFGTLPLNSHRIDGFTPIADELFRDSGVTIEAVLRTLAARSLAIKAAPYYADIDVGTGTNLPAAITVNITNGKTSASTTAPTMDEAIELYSSLLPQYRAMGSWIGNSTISLEFRLKKDADGNYLWQPSVSASEPDRFYGKPWYEDAYFDASATGNIPLIFGDVAQAYIVRRIGGIQVDLSRDFAFTSFETTARWAMYHDAGLIDTIAVKALTLA